MSSRDVRRARLSSHICFAPGAVVVEAAEDGAPSKEQPHGGQVTAGARKADWCQPRDLPARIRAPA